MKTKNFEQLRSDYLRDLSNQQPAAHTHPGSDNYARATALAALAEGQYQHQEWILRQVFADTADTAYLERHCAMYRIWRKAAAAAAGSIRISGAPNTVMPAGLVAQVGDIAYQTSTPGQYAVRGLAGLLFPTCGVNNAVIFYNSCTPSKPPTKSSATATA